MEEVQKILSDIRLFKSYLVNTGGNTEIENMIAANLNEKFYTFLLSITKKDGIEYEPSILRGFMCNLDHEKFKHKCEQWARIFIVFHSFKIKTKTVESFRVRQSTECFRTGGFFCFNYTEIWNFQVCYLKLICT
jgi:hypothetical protein